MDSDHGIPEVFRQTGLYLHRPTDTGLTETGLTQFQVLGERGSATNLVRKLIDKNLPLMRTEALGWKHGVPGMVAIPPDFLVVAVVRDARDWALSMHKRPWHADPAMQALPFAAFLRAEWRGIVDRPEDFDLIHPEIRDRVQGLPLHLDRHPITGLPYPNLFALRRTKLAGLLSFLHRECNLLLVRAETVQDDPAGFVTWVQQQTGLPLEGGGISGVKRRLGTRFNPSVARREATPESLAPEDLAFLRAELDLPLEAALGYSYD
ncbi:MAG: hypothetical protein R3197_09250 [Paracoccaceae bacterium]|nr:hypothetical protein [Paracoccaceae bacterium]